MLHLKGRAEAAVAAHRAQAWHTWHLMLPHVGKSMPDFDKFAGIPTAASAPRPQTGAELEAIGRRWHAALNARRK